jgi:hypothetical protein
VNRLRGLIADYRRTLKRTELEEWLDLVFYRPLAYGFARLLAPTPFTPDAVTRLSAAAGFAAGICFWQGRPALNLWGAALFGFGNVLDCADGMLARLRGRCSPVGRALDGLADYMGTAAVFLGLGHGLAAHHASTAYWGLVVAAGVSMAWLCSIVDRTRLEWQQRALGSWPGRDVELRGLRDLAERWRMQGTRRRDRILVSLYAFYWRLWDRFLPGRMDDAEGESIPASVWASARRPVLRMALPLGPSTHITALCVAAALGHVEFYLWGVVTIGNLWGAFVLTSAALADRRLAVRETPAEVAKGA